MENSVSLLGHYGSDEIIACSAWISTSNELTEEKKGRIGSMIKSLWENGHETPFEKGQVHFIVTTDIASHIHLLKHRISSINAESARYKQIKEDRYYIPEDWTGIVPSSSRVKEYFDYPSDSFTWKDALEQFASFGNLLYHECLKDLTPIIGRKRAKESARFFKTYNSQIQADVMFNMRSFANFQKLRNSEHAQNEIREIAEKMFEQVSKIEGNPFKYTLESISPYKPIIEPIKGLSEQMIDDYTNLMMEAGRVFIEPSNKYWIIKAAEHELAPRMIFNKEIYNREDAIKKFKQEIYNKNSNNGLVN